MEIVGLYLFCCDQSEVPEVDQRCADIKEQNENSASSVELANNILGVHYNIFDNVKDKLAPFVEHLLKYPDQKKNYWCFCLFLNLRYAEYLKEISELHGVEGVHSKNVIFEMKSHLLYYFASFKNLHNPIVEQISSTVQEASIHSDDEGTSCTFMYQKQTNMYMNERLAQEFRAFWEAMKASGTVTDVLGWYQ